MFLSAILRGKDEDGEGTEGLKIFGFELREEMKTVKIVVSWVEMKVENF
jgi:hypothetical protein